MYIFKQKIVRLMRKRFLFISFLLLYITQSFAQSDPIFTQYMNSMQIVNPAYAGMWDKVGFQVLSRRYYVGQNRAPLSTSLVLYSPIKNENNGIGLVINDDRLGYQKRLSMTVNYAYQVKLDWKTNLRFGMKAGVLHFDNLLSKYDLFPDGVPDPNFLDDVDIRFMPQWGIGAILYTKDYFVSLSLPQLINNEFQTNRNNYSALAELKYFYLIGGYIFGKQRQVRFKPTAMLKAANGAKLEADIAANVLFFNKYWLGAMWRTNNTFAIYTELQLTRKLRFGYAIDYPLSKDIRKYQYGTHEFKLTYEYDFYRRPFTPTHYF